MSAHYIVHINLQYKVFYVFMAIKIKKTAFDDKKLKNTNHIKTFSEFRIFYFSIKVTVFLTLFIRERGAENCFQGLKNR